LLERTSHCSISRVYLQHALKGMAPLSYRFGAKGKPAPRALIIGFRCYDLPEKDTCGILIAGLGEGYCSFQHGQPPRLVGA
jgi:hypothetical protein